MALIAALAVLASLALTAAPASAAAPSTQMGAISDVSYTSAHVTGKVTTDGGDFGYTAYGFQYSTDEVNWTTAFSGLLEGGAFTDKEVDATISVPKGGTKYFVRLVANIGFFLGSEPEVPSPAPNPFFTTLAVEQPTIPGAVVASPIFSTSAKVSAKVKRPANENAAFDTSCRFEYIADAQYEENVNVNSVPAFTGATPAPCEQNPVDKDDVDAEGEKEVTAQLAGLTPSTAYHLRLIAENAAPDVVVKEAASTFTTEPKVAVPTVIAADDATDVTVHEATVKGELQRPAGADPALNVECRFEYATQAEWEANSNAFPVGALSAPCAENPITAETAKEVTGQLGGLKPATTYHLRLAAQNEGGTETKDAINTFTTLPAELPVVTIDPVAGGTYTTAHVTGTVEIDDPGHATAGPYIEISTDDVNWSRFEHPTIEVGGLGVVEHTFTDLQPSTTYFFRIRATYSGDSYENIEANGEFAQTPEPNPSITTGELFPPTSEDLEAKDITATTAHFSALVDPHAPAGLLSELGKKATATHWEFVCTPECKNVNGNPIEGTVQGEEGSKAVFGDARRLDPNTCYEISLVIHSEGGDETLGPVVFCTPLIKPTVGAAPGGSDGKGGYVLQGTVNPNNSPVGDCTFAWGPEAHEELNEYAFQADCSPVPPIEGVKAVTVEAPLTGLTNGANYNFRLFATNAAGTEKSANEVFTPTLAVKEPCENEQIRKENSSLALPECRAYEMVTPPGKEGFGAFITGYDGGRAVSYTSGAGNLARSGQSSALNSYVATRSEVGWETIPNLNGASGSIWDTPSDFELPVPRNAEPAVYSTDLHSSLWSTHRKGDPDPSNFYLRNPDGTFTKVGSASQFDSCTKGADFDAVSADLSHIVVWGEASCGTLDFGPGIYEYVGTGVDQPRRVDLDNTDSPVSACVGYSGAAHGNGISTDGRVIFFTVNGGCGAPDPPADEIWARIGATSFDVSASHCARTAPADPCNAPSAASFQAAAADGSRVFFTTNQQLVDADTDQANDIYACDLPTGNPAPSADKANPCAAFTQVSAGDSTGAAVEKLGAISDNGATALFTAKGVLADNEDALGNLPLAGDHNLYVWRSDASHPTGQTHFVGRLDSDDVILSEDAQVPQATPDGRYLVFTTASQLLDTDTDNARDVYRYDADTGELSRASTNVFGVAGNSDGVDANLPSAFNFGRGSGISDDGRKVAFSTTEPLSPADGNGEADVYLWTPERVSLISTGTAGGGATNKEGSQPLRPGRFTIDGSGDDIYFETPGALTPADGDDISDVYDARVDGGFSFAQAPPCSGEVCQPSPVGTPSVPAPATTQPPADPGNVKPKICPKGKVAKGNKCVKKSHRKHHKKKGKGHAKRASHNRGGSK